MDQIKEDNNDNTPSTRSSLRSNYINRINVASSKKPNSQTAFKEEQIKVYTDPEGKVYNVGEHCYMDTKENNQPFAIALIIDFKMTRKDYYYIEVQWYYRPNEIPDGIYIPLMQDRYIENKNVAPNDLAVCLNATIKSRELFASECRDIYPASYIKGKCKVYHYQDILEAKHYINPKPDTFFCTLTYNPEARRLANTQGEIRVGGSHQAKLPTCQLQVHPNDMYEKCDTWYEMCKWKCAQIGDQDLLTYLQAARSIAAFVGMCDRGSTDDMYDVVQRDDTTINALNILHENSYDPSRSLQTLVKYPIAKGIDSKWCDDDQKKFVKGLRQWGKNFHRIRKDLLPHKETSELVEFYYLWKKTPSAQNSKPRKRIRPPSTVKKTSNKKQANNITNLATNSSFIIANSSNNNNLITSGTSITNNSMSNTISNSTILNNNEHFSGSDQMDSDQESDDSESKSSVLCCKHCATTTSKDWQHGGQDNLLLCYDCRMYYKKYGELPRINPITPTTIVTQALVVAPTDEARIFKPINENPSPVDEQTNKLEEKVAQLVEEDTQHAIDLSTSNANQPVSSVKIEQIEEEKKSPIKHEAEPHDECVQEKKIKLESPTPMTQEAKPSIETKQQDLNISITSAKTSSSRSCTPSTNPPMAIMSPHHQLPFGFPQAQPPLPTGHLPTPFGYPHFNSSAFNPFARQPNEDDPHRQQATQFAPLPPPVPSMHGAPGSFHHLFHQAFPPFPPPSPADFMLGHNFRPPGISSPLVKSHTMKNDDDQEMEYVDDPPPQPINVSVHKPSELKKPESNAMFTRVWDRGANSCSRTDLTFKYIPNCAYLKSKAERKQAAEQKAKEESRKQEMSRLQSPCTTSGFQQHAANNNNSSKLKTSSSLAEMQKFNDSFAGGFDSTSRVYSPRTHAQSPLVKDNFYDSTPALRQLRDIADRSTNVSAQQFPPGFPRIPNLDPQAQQQLFNQFAYFNAMENHRQSHGMAPMHPAFMSDPHMSMRNSLMPPHSCPPQTQPPIPPPPPSHQSQPPNLASLNGPIPGLQGAFTPNYSALQEFQAARDREITATVQQILRRQPNLNQIEATAQALAQFTKKDELSRMAVLERERALHPSTNHLQDDLQRRFERDRQMQLLANFNHEDMFR